MPRTGSLTHGASAWRTRRCSCTVCEEASRELARRNTASRFERLKADPSVAPHGRYSTYINWGCRCDECGAARMRYHQGERLE